MPPAGLTLRLELLCYEPVSKKLRNGDEVISQLLSRLEALDGVAVTPDGDIRHRGGVVGHLDRAERRLTVPLRRDIPIGATIADELVAEYPRLRREGDNLVLDLDVPEAADAGEKLLRRRLLVDTYASQYLGSSP